MNSENKKIKNAEWILIAIVVAVLSGLLIWKNYPTKEERAIDKALEKVVVPEVTRKQEDDMAETFPTFIPLNAKTEMVDSYQAKYPNSTLVQGTMIFKSSSTADKNFEYYKKWAIDNGWAVVNSSSADPLYSLYLKKNPEIINIVIKAQEVTITYVKK